MATVLTTTVVLDPNNQIAHILDATGLLDGTEYVITGTYLTYDTRFVYRSHLDITLFKQPVGVPAPQTNVTAQISTPYVVPPARSVATYPYGQLDRLRYAGANFDLQCSPGTHLPVSGMGASAQGKLWYDTSVSPAALRICTAPFSSGSYVAGEWATISMTAGGGSPVIGSDLVVNSLQTTGTGPTGYAIYSSGNMYVGNGISTNNVSISGIGGALHIVARDNSGVAFTIYANSGALRVYSDLLGDLFTMGYSGNVSVNTALYVQGNTTFYAPTDVRSSLHVVGNINTDGAIGAAGGLYLGTPNQIVLYQTGPANTGFMIIYDNGGGGAIQLGGANDTTNYYGNDTHHFRSRAAASFAYLNSGGLTIYNQLYVGSTSQFVGLSTFSSGMNVSGNGLFYGNVTVNGTLTAGNMSLTRLTLTGSAGDTLYLPSGGVVIGANGYFAGRIQGHAGGDSAIYADNGGVTSQGRFLGYGGMYLQNGNLDIPSGVLNVHGAGNAVYAPNGDVYAGGSLTSVSSGIAVYAPNGTSYFGVVSVYNSISAAGMITAGQDLHATGWAFVNRVGGGPQGAGCLNSWGESHLLCFRFQNPAFAAGAGIFLRADEAIEILIPESVNCTKFNAYSGVGGATGWGVSCYHTGGQYLGWQVDSLSDGRLKENINDTSVDALDLLNQLPVREFDWKKEFMDYERRVGVALTVEDAHIPIGLIGQELEALVPEAVYRRRAALVEGDPHPADARVITLKALVPYLVRAVQQLTARLEALEGAE